MRIFNSTILFLFIITLLTACEIFKGSADNVTMIDIANTAYLGVDMSANFAEGATNNLIKVVDVNELSNFEIVEFFDSEGTLLGKDVIYARAWTFHPASEEYTIIAGEFIFKVNGGENRHFGLLLNTESGEIFGLEEYYFPDQYYGLQGRYYYQTDSEGNIYFVNPWQSHLYRILVNDGINLQLEKYMDAAAGIYDQRYLIDKQGNVYFQNGGRIKKHSGGIEETNMHFIAINGSDGKCYGFRQDWPDNVHMLLLEVKDGEFVSTKINENGFYFEGGVASAYQYFDSNNRRSIIIIDGYLVPERNFGSERLIGLVFDEETYELTPIVSAEDDFGQVIGPEGKYYWIKKSENQYIALDLSSIQIDSINNIAHIKESISVDIPAEFDITGALIDEGGLGINIYGFNLETETKYAGKITAEYGLQYYEESSVPYITTLSRLQ